MGTTLVEVTHPQLARIYRDAPDQRLERHLWALNRGAAEAQVCTPMRWAMYLAQLGHESCQFRWLEELWGPTPAQLRYEPPGRKAEELGNAFAGDGQRYRGRGVIQLTGRANYRAAGAELGLALEEHPELAAVPEAAHRIAAWYWRRHGVNVHADAGDVRATTRAINGGLLGLDEREALFERACDVLGV